MRHIYRQVVLGLVVATASAVAAAGGLSRLLSDYQQVRAQGAARTDIDIDNDSLLLNKDDGFYSSGMRLQRAYTLQQGDQATTFGWRIGQQLYTASDIKLPPQRVGPPNHPYAGWLYGGFFRDIHRDDGSHLALGIDLGCLGPCAGGKWTQTNLHRLLDQPLPQGWSRQVGNELGMILHAEMAPLRWQLASWLDATPVIHGRFGNIHADAGAGMRLRAGQLPSLGQPAGLHGFLRVDARAVAYNAMLQGGYFSSSDPHTVKPKRAVGEAELGLAWRSGPYGLSGSLVRRSTEISALSNAQGAQSFVRLQFSYAP